MKKLVMLVCLLCAGLLMSCEKFKDLASHEPHKKKVLKNFSNQIILDWNIVAFEAMGGATYQHPLFASHLNAMTHIAMHDALNAIEATYETYSFYGNDAKADPVATAASAAYKVLVATLPDQKGFLDGKLAESLQNVKEGESKTRGIELGKQAANAILALRHNDGADANPIGQIPPSTEPGVYQLVPPFDFIYAPTWHTMQPFGLQRPDQFRSVPQAALTSEAYTKDFNEVKSIGILNSTTRSADQTAYAHFWFELAEIGWNRIARVAAAKRKMDLLETARLFALVNITLTDSYISGWDSKFHYNFWRPYSGIRGASTDGNVQTEADATWEPLMPTPPVQDYPSTHSALGNGAATVLAELLGDNTQFTTTSSTSLPDNASRSFKSFSQAANENADSRVMAGVHFRFSCKAGQKLGNEVGEYIVKNKLRPLK